MHDTKHEASQDGLADQLAHDVSVDGPSGPPPGRRPGWASPRALLLAGGVLSLLLVVVFGGFFLASWQPSQKVQPTQAGRPKALPTTAQGARPRVIPAAVGKPIKAPIATDHYIGVSIDNGVAYVGTTGNTVYALRAGTGNVLWHTAIEGDASDSQGPLVVDGIVYLSSYVAMDGPGHLYALRASDGAILWQFAGDKADYSNGSTNNYLYRPVVANGVLYLNAQNAGLIAFNATSGAVLWRVHLKGSSYASPVVANGAVYIGASEAQQGNVYALRALDGAILWQHQMTNGSLLDVEHDGIYLSSNGTLLLLRASDGEQIWSQKLDATFFQAPQLVDGVLYLAATKVVLPPGSSAQNDSPLSSAMAFGALVMNDLQLAPMKETRPLKEGISTLYAVNASNGAVLWHFPFNKGADSWASWLAVQQGVVYAAASDASSNANRGYVYALRSKDGSVLWQDEIPTNASYGVVEHGVIYLSGSQDEISGGVYALRTEDGSLLWSYPLSGTAISTPILVDTTLYVCTANGMIYALHANDGSPMWHYLAQP